MQHKNMRLLKNLIIIVLLAGALLACSSKPLVPYSTQTPPLALVPVTDAGVVDERGRFREIFCTVLEERGEQLPDYRPCARALTRLGVEPAGTGAPVYIGPSRQALLVGVVPGVGWECIEGWLNVDESTSHHLGSQGFKSFRIKIDGLSGTETNARQIRDAILALPPEDNDRPLILIGYSKGAPDILQAIVTYPELAQRITAVVSAGGAIGGSPLALGADQKDLGIMKHVPKSECTDGDGGALASLRPFKRQTWMAGNPLPQNLKYYSLVTLPSPDRISSILDGPYKKLAQIDPRNDGQLLFYDQIIPNSTLLAYLNADHWALAVPIARSHSIIGSTVVDKNDYPREALIEALLRFIEEDLYSGNN
jgi:pimeloyl-ACP methyl ester carboxylesterase